MTSQARIKANRENARKSTGPKSDEGKARARLNGLKHGLRSEEVVLPTESADDFEAHRQAWFDDWQPASETRRFLVERAALAAWRLRRVARVEAEAIRSRMDEGRCAWDASVREGVNAALVKMSDRPEESVAALMATRAGIEALERLWSGLAEDLDDPECWTSLLGHHDRLRDLIGYRSDLDRDDDRVAIAQFSWSILIRNTPSLRNPDDEAIDDDEAAELAATLRAVCRDYLDDLASRRESMAADPRREARAEASAFATVAGDAPLHRYEARLDREARAAIGLLVRLEKSGADLPQVEELEEVAAEVADAPSEAKDEASGGAEARPKVADRDRGGRVWGVDEVVEGTKVRRGRRSDR